MDKELRIAFIMPHLKSGGIERCRIHLMEHFVSLGLNVDLVVAKLEGELVGSIPQNVKVYEVGKEGVFTFFCGILNYINAAGPSCMLSGHEDVNCLVMAANYISRKHSATVLSNHSIYSKVVGNSSGLDQLKNSAILLLMKWAYKRANAIVAVTEAVAKDLASCIDYPVSKIVVVNNPVVRGNVRVIRKENSACHIADTSLFLVTFVGRLHSVKNIDILIRAIAKIKGFSGLRLKIVGDGPCGLYLKRLVRFLAIEHVVEFSGYVENPISIISSSDLLVLPSQHEASGNVLVEAMSCGVQLIATSGDHGPVEILEQGRLGQLVTPGSIDEMVEAIINVVTKKFWVDPSLLICKAEEFTIEGSAKKYLSIINDVVT